MPMTNENANEACLIEALFIKINIQNRLKDSFPILLYQIIIFSDFLGKPVFIQRNNIVNYLSERIVLSYST